MNVPFYDNNGKLHHLFIPSLDILAYSQSSTFNTLFFSMFNNGPEVKIEYSRMVTDFFTGSQKQEDTATVKTIGAMLQCTKDKANLNGDKQTEQACDALLKQLPEFSKRWINQYHMVMSTKRTPMQGESFNEYLAYSTQRLKVDILPSLKEGDSYRGQSFIAK